MKFLITGYKDKQEKEDIKKQGLYCYDLRHSDDGTEIATIEKSVLVNRIGSIITDQEIIFGDKYPNNYIDYEEFIESNESVSKIEELLQTKQYSNKEIINIVKEQLQKSKYKDFKLQYVIKNRDEQENCYAIAINDNKRIGFNPFEKEIEEIPSWGYSFDNELFNELEWNKEIIFMSIECHINIWKEIEEFYPYKYEYKEGILEYVEYCKKNNISIKEIQKASNDKNITDIIKFLTEQYLKPSKAKFNTKIVSDMKHNGEIVEVIGFSKGKDIYNDRYTVRFNDGTVSDNIMSVELDFNFEKNKVNSIKHRNKER